jgi:hypothetical protein
MPNKDDLRARITQLENQINPPPRPPTRPPHDYSANLSMPKSALRAMTEAVPERLMSELRADARCPNPVTGHTPTPQPTGPTKRSTGWIDEVPLQSPPGQRHIHALVSAQDRLDLADRAQKFAQAGLNAKGE